MNSARINRLQNLAILVLTLSAVLLFADLPLFGALSDQSLYELARLRLRQEPAAAEGRTVGASSFVLPVRMVFTNHYTRFGEEALTTLSNDFERAGTWLGEAIGSAYAMTPVSESAFLAALRGEGLYFDFTVALPPEFFADMLGVTAAEAELGDVRRMLLFPMEDSDAALFVQDGAGSCYRFSTAVSSTALADFLAALDGNGVDFAFMLGEDYAALSPYTLVMSETPSPVVLSASNALGGNEDELLRLSGFSTHSDNRFIDSSGTVIVREVSNTLYLRPDGTVDYQGGIAEDDSICFVPAAEPGVPTRTEAAAAAQTLAAALLQNAVGDAALYLSGVSGGEGVYEITFDFMSDGTPIRFMDGSHAVTVTVTGQSITAYTLRMRHYTPTEETAPLLPLSLSAAIARGYEGTELSVAYVDVGGELVSPAWIAD